MSALKCRVCGKFRKHENVATPDGLTTPPCWNCNDPGWVTPYEISCAYLTTHEPHYWTHYDFDADVADQVRCPGNFLTKDAP